MVCINENIIPNQVCSHLLLQEKSDSSDAGKESSSEGGADGQDASSSSSSKTKDSTPGYEEKVVKILFRWQNKHSE